MNASTTTDRTDGVTWAASVLLCLVLCALLFVASEVREQACFWVEACGVSRWLRTAVQLGYYPALLGVALLLGYVTIRFPLGLRLVSDWSSRFHRLLREPVAWLWLVFAGVIVNTTADNLLNVATGMSPWFDAPMACCAKTGYPTADRQVVLADLAQSLDHQIIAFQVLDEHVGIAENHPARSGQAAARNSPFEIALPRQMPATAKKSRDSSSRPAICSTVSLVSGIALTARTKDNAPSTSSIGAT
jgi:hypothetical protein